MSWRSIGKRSWALALALALLLTAVPVRAAVTVKPDESVPVQVGLYYGSTAAPTFNLQNVTGCGSGYRLGYFDSGLDFVQLGYTSEAYVSVLKTHNIYLTSSNTYTDEETGNGVVGCFHVQLPGSYADFESAKAVADASGGFVAWIAGTYYVRVGSYTTRAAATEAATAMGGTLAETSAYGISLTVTGTTRILFQFDDQGMGSGFAVKPGLDDSVKTETWCKGFRYFGSFRYERVNGKDLTLVNLVPMDDYINCVISREMSESWPLEALKAQAVCARTYYAINCGRHDSYHFDICSATHCQVYYGTSRIGENTARAAAETSGQYLWYGGELVETFYASSSGGASENSENVWTDAQPYLVGTVDPYEALVADRIPNYNWTVTLTGSEIQQKLIDRGRTGCGLITGVTLTSTEMGNVYSITFHDANGRNWTIYKESCRTFLGLPSMRFGLEDGPPTPGDTVTHGETWVNGDQTVDLNGGVAVIDGSGNVTVIEEIPYVITASGAGLLDTVTVENLCGGSVTSTGSSFVFKGSGNGHNIGMSQWGAYAMAEQGFTYVDILTFYYTGTTLG